MRGRLFIPGFLYRCLFGCRNLPSWQSDHSSTQFIQSRQSLSVWRSTTAMDPETHASRDHSFSGLGCLVITLQTTDTGMYDTTAKSSGTPCGTYVCNSFSAPARIPSLIGLARVLLKICPVRWENWRTESCPKGRPRAGIRWIREQDHECPRRMPRRLGHSHLSGISEFTNLSDYLRRQRKAGNLPDCFGDEEQIWAIIVNCSLA